MLTQAFALALGALALSPFEFWVMTPMELDAMADGYRLRERQAWERTACLLSALTGQKIDLDKMLQPLKSTKHRPVVAEPTTQAEADKFIDEMNAINDMSAKQKRERWPELFGEAAGPQAVEDLLKKKPGEMMEN